MFRMVVIKMDKFFLLYVFLGFWLSYWLLWIFCKGGFFFLEYFLRLCFMEYILEKYRVDVFLVFFSFGLRVGDGVGRFGYKI